MNPTEGICAVILAAGLSRRMGDFKPLLPLGRTTVLETTAAAFREAGVDTLRVVVGHRWQEIQSRMARLSIPCIVNPDYPNGMFSSLHAGIRALPGRCRAFFVHPADIPLVRAHTLSQLMRAHHASPEAVIHPAFEGRRGHPPLVPIHLASHILQWPLDAGGLRAFWQQHGRHVEVPVIDQGVLLDLDFPDAYRAIAGLARRRDLPSAAEREALLRLQAVPDEVIRHCRATASVAGALAAALNQAGVRLDLELVEAAALLHDIARGQKRHAAVGARLLESHGFTSVAAIVGTHMDLLPAPDQAVDEAQLVYLADKLVQGERLVDLEERFATRLAECARDPQAAAAVQQRKAAARHIQAAVERLTGTSIFQLYQDHGLPGPGPCIGERQ